MRIWRLIGVGILLLFSLNQAHALINNILINNNILVNFQQLVQAVEHGNNVRAIIHFDRCIVTAPDSLDTHLERILSGATTRFNFTHYFHAHLKIDDRLIDTVTTSMKLFIDHPSGKLLTVFGRLSVFEDNTATVHVDLMDPVAHTHLLVIDWLCTISNGQDNNGLVLFDFF
ncbi:hypothetical protein Lgra_1414 [Legionella gratiana]|uniref:Uncharacterized protein n=1 Tax=Legionella gratiana TaxID=45066 RepID=A0A378JNU2_9GAMM|nr:hypothetical protein [Legionella gratiana]KTD11956.1 hypothetical protein Lgra_1414 [Legionella gratiana]STX46440.1 Uncharacterised protein [Legionella gratiana]